MNEIKQPIIAGIIGLCGSIGLPLAALLAQVEIWLRLMSLVVGISVGILSIISLIKTLTKK